MVRVKICGVTSVRDAETALTAGADAIGLVFAPSPRRVTLAAAERIARAVGPWITTVGVFVNEELLNVIRVASTCRLSAIQPHGDESVEYVRRLSPFKIIKAFRVGAGFEWGEVRRYEAAAFLFDTKAGGKRGGTGRTFDWSLLTKRKFLKPVILSGGLNPKNVRQAVKAVSPYGVDASSGVESSPGVKDAGLVREFIRNAKQI